MDSRTADAERSRLNIDGLATRRGTRETYFTTVGYGLQQRKPYLVNQPKRMYAVSDLINLTSNLVRGVGLQTTNNPGDGRGGNCSGDSGGPILLQDSDVIVAVNSFGLNNTCKGNDFAYRVDTEARRTSSCRSSTEREPRASDRSTTDPAPGPH